MSDYTTYAGMDVHARSVTICAAVAETGELFRRTLAGCPTAADVAGYLLALPQPVYCAYESGCTGFHLARELRGLGVDCDVIAVSTLPRSTKDRQSKCDKLDARAVLSAIRNPESTHTCVWVPDEATEAGRNLARACEQAARDVKRAKQELSSFLLAHGHVWDERTKSGRLRKAWTRGWWEWACSLELPERAARLAFDHYARCVRRAEEELAEMRRLVAAEADEPANKPYVDALTQVNGIDVSTAYLLRVEFGDFSRFASGRKVSCWAGTVPSNGSSGERERRGAITAAGNKYVRRRLVESVGCIARWRRARKAPRDGSSSSPAAGRMAADANARIMGRYRRLTAEGGKHPNKAKVAVVNELVRWVWAIGLQVQREQEAAARR